MGVGCEAHHLPSISPNFSDGFCAIRNSYASASIYARSGWACGMMSSFLFTVGEALFLDGKE